jgi:hypothetical protein
MAKRSPRSDKVKLHDRYRAPRFRIGSKAACEVRGELRIVGVTDAPIPWPLGVRGPGKRSLIVYGDLLRAVRRESVSAMCHWFGVSDQTVTNWRKALGVPERNYGTRKLWEVRLEDGYYLKGLQAAARRTQDPIAVAKRAAALRGRPRPAPFMEPAHSARRGTKHSTAALQSMRDAWQQRRKRRRKPAGGWWKAWEDALVRSASISEVTRWTGRTRAAVQWRRRVLARAT